MQAQSLVRTAPASANLYEILDLILDKGLVVDVYARISLVGIEILTVEVRVVIASVDTFLHYAKEIDKIGHHRGNRMRRGDGARSVFDEEEIGAVA
jgi:hypothetical protein